MDGSSTWFPSRWRFDSSKSRSGVCARVRARVRQRYRRTDKSTIDRRDDYATTNDRSRVSHCRARARMRGSNRCVSRRFDFRFVTVTNQDSIKRSTDPRPPGHRRVMNQKKKWRRGAPKTMTSHSHARFAFAFAFVDAPCARATHRTKERNDDE